MQPILDIALDLCASLAAEDRYRRLVHAVRRLVPCDSAVLLRLTGDVLVPIVADGLRPEVLGRRFAVAEHPRLQRILEEPGPVRFGDSALPDPFDGLFLGGDVLSRAHACMGCALRVGGDVVGVLAADAMDPRAFDGLDDDTVTMLAALAGAAMHTAGLIERLEQLVEKKELVARQLVREARAGSELIGQGAAMRRLREEVALLGGADLTVLITGETGVGKEVVARSIHDQSGRSDQALIYVNCAALPESIAESELFGHVRGAFTGATADRAGKFEAADRGTLLLDEIGELPLTVQAKLLRVLQSGDIQRVGSDRALRVDVRVLAATNRNLADEVRAGRFRADLYHRLSVYPLAVPPLRERAEDIPLLAGYFLDQARARLGVGPVRLTDAALARLQGYAWPGNVRELQHLLLRAALRASGGRRREPVLVDVPHLGLEPAPGDGAGAGGRAPEASPIPDELQLSAAADDFRRHVIQTMLQRTSGNWAEAARRMGMDRGNLHHLARRLGILGASAE